MHTYELNSSLLPNRRAFQEALEREWKHGIRAHSLLSLLYVDADHFKNYNDQYGHEQGDYLLRAIGKSIQDHVHQSRDLAARYGGEEFLILLPDTKAADARAMAEKIRQTVMKLGFIHAQSPFGVATVSIGVATVYPSIEGEGTVLKRAADRALYQAKEAGRNCVRGAEEAQAGPNIVSFRRPG